MVLGDSRFMAKYSAFSPYRLHRRETGFPDPIGIGDAISSSLYCGMKPIASWDYAQSSSVPTGGVFNLEFSPEGTLLVAACEKMSIQLFDPLTHQRINQVNNAHLDCVNCVKFLDSRMFATCSDDRTIALWDVRNLSKKIRSLLGHTKWVKNIEFSVKDKLLVTSCLEGSIFTWDINSYTECNVVHEKVFHGSGLMRCRLSPDGNQMVMCTTGGLLIIVHNLNLATMGQHLHKFKPNLYRLMQTSKQVFPMAAAYNHLFDEDRKENRLEFVTDFPEENDAEVISALQIHPQGWSALSRNISHDDRSEWTCIHDIQPLPPRDKSVRDPPPPRRSPRRRHPVASQNRPNTSSEEPQPEAASAEARQDAAAPGLSSIQNDVWEASITIKQHRTLQALYSRGQVGRNFNMQRIMGISTGIAPPILRPRLRASPRPPRPPRLASRSRLASVATTPQPAPVMLSFSDINTSWSPSTSGQTPPSPVRQNADRLLYYIEETNEARGFIKELCYSADGRVVCSPFGRGMRLLALNERCSELSHCVQDFTGPRQMVEIGQSLGIHQDLVVCCKFSPRHHLLVTGCLEGKVVWHAPFSGEDLY